MKQHLVLLLLLIVDYATLAAAAALMKAWTCHGRSQKDLVSKLCQANIISSKEVRDVMERVDRRFFCPNKNPYRDAPQPIGKGQTISAPHMHAHVLEEMLPYLRNSRSSTLQMLDVGCGSGYLTACMGEWALEGDIMGKKGTVFGIDVWNNLVEQSRANIHNCNPTLIESNTVRLGVGDGWKGGRGLVQKKGSSTTIAAAAADDDDDGTRFDAIHVGAAASDFPQPLLLQLKVGGVLIIPVGPEQSIQTLYKVERLRESASFQSKDFTFQPLFNVRYVPLVHP